LIKKSVELKKNDNSLYKNEESNIKSEVTAFLELDTKRFHIKKSDHDEIKKYSKKDATKYAKF